MTSLNLFKYVVFLPDLTCQRAWCVKPALWTIHAISWLWKKANYLFEVDVSVAAKSCFDMLCPLSLPLRVFLSAQSVDVMREQGGRLIRGVSQTAAGHPRLQAARRRGATCVIKTTHLITIFKKTTFPSYSARETHFKATVTHIPGANKYRDHVGLTQLRVPGFHQLEELAEGITFLKDTETLSKLRERKKSGFQFIIKTHHLAFSYPRTLKRHLPRCAVVAVDNQAHLGGTALELDNLKDWCARNVPADSYSVVKNNIEMSNVSENKENRVKMLLW